MPPEAPFRGMQISLAAARRGDRDAFASLVTPHTPKLQRLARRLTRSVEDAEDVCQESLLKAFTKIDQFDGTKIEIEEFRAWLMRITTNCAIDFLRRRKARRFISLEDCDNVPTTFHEAGRGWCENPEKSYTRAEQLGIVGDAISRLPADLRMVCLFRNVRELSTKETAARLGISTIAVRLRLFRAHRQLRKMLGRRMHRRSGRVGQTLAA
jgi:RNA polymerase sigma factor (sigma-70 family)